MDEQREPRSLVIRIHHEELVVRRRYEAASILNDVLIAVWFIVGSVLFFSTAWATPGTWCFLLGSVQLLIRPLIRFSRHLHLQRVRADKQEARDTALADGGADASGDY
ncbi:MULTISPECIES: YrhK family protein [Streptomyces]|uniref:YrhK domain-containing protein n=1 Tax=Streptomyces cacaoi TaxID=1898 RepID=A0A4Y3R5X0_STRCI|nr:MULTISPECIES: YrhK family protein [Streptomyces]NNG88433.1 YrhK family protein [Streptomyces cacaoi]QHF96026.1 hypothetical protein DEH18_21615 [Streptomyces sp. NHF165]GEB53045.1 hypothetical protein SCA03_55960 [Streptomyces cacaoi]